MTDTTRYGAGRYDEPDGPPRTGARSEVPSGSIAGLLQEIIGNVQGIIRSEVQLAKTEVREEATAAGRAAGLLVAGAVLGAYALGFVLLAAVYALDLAMPGWLAALIVGLLVAVTAGVLAKIGLARIKQFKPVPEQTIDTLKEDVQWVKQQAR